MVKRDLVQEIIILFIFIVLSYFLSTENYLLFHTLAELFSIIVAYSLFAIAWNSRQFNPNKYLLFMGIAYLFIGSVDLVHTLSYEGMNIFTGFDSNLPTQFWIIARYMEAISLLAALFFINKKIRTTKIVIIYLLITSLALFSVFFEFFPVCFVEGSGLTIFKIISEYLISAILLFALWLFHNLKHYFIKSIRWMIYSSLILTILSEISFTFYVSVFGLSNFIGHIFKFISFYLIYKALIASSLKQPYKLLFSDLKKSEEKHRTIIETAISGFWITNIKGDIVEVNNAYCKMSGYTKDELLTMKISDIEESDTKEDIKNRINYIIKNGADEFETRHRRKDGSVYDVAVKIQYQSLDEGSCIVFLEDITDRKKAEEALIESEERFKALHNASFGGITIHDKGIILECNNGLCEISGYEKDELIGMDGLLLIEENSREIVMKNILSAYEKPYEVTGVRKNGEIYPLRLEAREIPYKGKNVRVVEFRDITEQKKMEEEILQTRKMESIGKLAGGIAHDLNNLLTPVLGYSGMLKENKTLGEKEIQQAEKIYASADRAADLVGKLLAFSRKQPVSFKALNLNEIINDFVALLGKTIHENIDIKLDLDNTISNIKGDLGQIEQIVMNLCVNSQDALPEGGEIIIKTFSVKDKVCLSVRDNGEGIEESLLPDIFEPFFSTKGINGTGLGLSTVYGIVKKHKGQIEVKSAKDEGCEFLIKFPVSTDDPEDKKKDNKTVNNLSLKRILLVEDDDEILDLIESVLTEEGLLIEKVGNGKEAVKLLEKDSGFDLIISDVIMPEMTGLDLYELVSERYKDIKFLFISGYSNDFKINEKNLYSTNIFIQKPFSPEALVFKINEIIDDTFMFE